jgi:hypothetical protein
MGKYGLHVYYSGAIFTLFRHPLTPLLPKRILDLEATLHRQVVAVENRGASELDFLILAGEPIGEAQRARLGFKPWVKRS